MIDEIRFVFLSEDEEMLNKCKETFGDRVRFQQEGSLTGFDLAFVAIIPTIGVAFAIIDFALRYFAKNNDDTDKEKAFKMKRKIEISKTRISLYNYEADEAAIILKTLFGENDGTSN